MFDSLFILVLSLVLTLIAPAQAQSVVRLQKVGGIQIWNQSPIWTGSAGETPGTDAERCPEGTIPAVMGTADAWQTSDAIRRQEELDASRAAAVSPEGWNGHWATASATTILGATAVWCVNEADVSTGPPAAIPGPAGKSVNVVNHGPLAAAPPIPEDNSNFHVYRNTTTKCSYSWSGAGPWVELACDGAQGPSGTSGARGRDASAPAPNFAFESVVVSMGADLLILPSPLMLAGVAEFGYEFKLPGRFTGTFVGRVGLPAEECGYWPEMNGPTLGFSAEMRWHPFGRWFWVGFGGGYTAYDVTWDWDPTGTYQSMWIDQNNGGARASLGVLFQPQKANSFTLSFFAQGPMANNPLLTGGQLGYRFGKAPRK